MARPTVPFEIGARVAEYTSGEGYLDKGLIVAGYTYWSNSLSVLTVDPRGTEREWVHGWGLKLVPPC